MIRVKENEIKIKEEDIESREKTETEVGHEEGMDEGMSYAEKGKGKKEYSR